MIYMYTIGYSIVTLEHLVGLILLCNSTNHLPNQRLLAINIALVEMLFGCYSVTSFSAFMTDPYDKYWRLSDAFFGTLLTTEIKLTVLHMILDRCLEIYSNVKYPLYMSTKRMKTLLVALWIFSGIIASINTVLGLSLGHLIAGTFLTVNLLLFDIVILIASIVTYVYFYSTVRKIKRLESIAKGHPHHRTMSLINDKFRLPCYIVSTYILLNFTSMVILISTRYLHGKDSRKILVPISFMLSILGFISDGFIYVFANKNVRKLLTSRIRKRSTRVTGMTTTSAFSTNIL